MFFLLRALQQTELLALQKSLALTFSGKSTTKMLRTGKF
jgi:hypothetical protein